tara:strand:+ start:148 stop:2286 length:2139 start_codon:yes stop_codon:yes gene_type:complete
MKENLIGFYTWYQVFDEMSIDQQNEIIHYIKKISRNIEQNINLAGGIAGKKIKIFNDIVYPKDTNKDHFIQYLKKNKEIFFLPSFPNYFDYKSITQDEINFSQYFQLDEFGTYFSREDLHWNVFSTQEYDPSPLVDFSKAHFKDKNIILFLNDGYFDKTNSKKVKYKKELEKDIKVAKKNNFDYKIFSNLHENQSELVKFMKSTSKDDILLFHNAFAKPLDFEDFDGDIKWIMELRKKILTTYVSNVSESDLFTPIMDPRELYDFFNLADCLPNKKILSRDHTSEGSFGYLRMQDLHFEVDPLMKPHISAYLSMYHGWQFEDLMLVKYIFDKKDYKFTNREEFLRETSERLKLINGEDDIYIGDSKTLSFDEKQQNTINDSFLFQHKKAAKDNDFVESILYKDQYKYNLVKKRYGKVIKTNYVNIDIIRFQDISIEESIFTAKFYLELTTTNPEGIDILAFNNSTLNSQSSIIKIDHNKIDKEYYYFRYLIEDTFSFSAIPDNYPFDKQLIFIDISIINEEKYGMLQSQHVSSVDQKFDIDGWALEQTRSGPFREKIKRVFPVNDFKQVTQKISTRVGWVIERSSSMTLLKVLIPLSFLWLLVLYGLFLPVENLDRAVIVITTAFLSGIALYFSTERPQPLRMTVIDIVFAFFYLTVGIASIAVFSLNFFPEIYNDFMGFVKYLLPFSIILGYIFLRRRIKSKRFFPRMTSR